ncbi:tyrosine-type recombinase/integrase [Limnohabitans sp. Rim47]|uniref:tyrosine-type recombinase/integrase n=1 Tax=Limnohabitans sp. Rim47 TaxID=1100721 RepID=UPI0002E73B2C|nr:tyrosine-type recombinase/integrase [Limnohabitans sp. Rim47]
MTLKKQEFSDDEIPIFEDALVYKRGEYWQMRMWLAKEHKYARFSLKTRNRSTAIDKAKLHYHELMAGQLQGKSYFSITTRMGVEMYLEHRKKDVTNGFIVSGRYNTIATHLKHWLTFIGKDVKLKELERTDCEDYFASRTKTKKKETIRISQTTVENEQSSVNAMMAWLYKHKETYIDGFDFKKLKAVDKGSEANRRNTFTDDETARWTVELSKYIKEAEKDWSEPNNLVKAVCGYYLGFSLITGLRRGEQLQLKWSDIEDMEHTEARGNGFDLIKVTVRGETSKVRKTRQFVVKDSVYLKGLIELTRRRHKEKIAEPKLYELVKDELMFSTNGKTAITARAIGIHFDKLVALAKIPNSDKRGLVPYSLRHYFITQRVNSNLPPASVAEMCGTSITQIEKTYYHTTEAKMISNALADYEYKDGMLIPK